MWGSIKNIETMGFLNDLSIIYSDFHVDHIELSGVPFPVSINASSRRYEGPLPLGLQGQRGARERLLRQDRGEVHRLRRCRLVMRHEKCPVFYVKT